MSKIRLTGKQSWKPRAIAYGVYKRHVLAAFMDAVKGHESERLLLQNAGMTGKPLTTSRKQKGRMRIYIRWYDDRHGDPEGVFGAIADALFAQDKYLAIDGVDFDLDPCGQGSVKVEVSV